MRPTEKQKAADKPVTLGGSQRNFTKAQMKEQASAINFFEAKLEAQPGMARYEHLLGALHIAKGDNVKATTYLKSSIASSNNVMTRNDLALHLARTGNLKNPDSFKEAASEFKKAFLIAGDEQPVLHKNVGALYAAHGDYQLARDHTRRALEINPNDSSSHRNYSKVIDQLGDQRSALKHNLEAIRLDERQRQRPNPSSYRAAAVQNLCKGGDLNESVQLMRQARIFENKKYVCPTSIRTQEIISKIMKRCGDPLEELEKEEKALAERKAIEESVKTGEMTHLIPTINRVGKYTKEGYG